MLLRQMPDAWSRPLRQGLTLLPLRALRQGLTPLPLRALRQGLTRDAIAAITAIAAIAAIAAIGLCRSMTAIGLGLALKWLPKLRFMYCHG